jgi:DNA-binding IclR family transcriptional regulator
VAGVQSVERAIAILREVGVRPGGLVDLADRTNLATSTAARLLATLEREGVLRRDGAGVYRIGPDVIAMAGPTAASDIVSRARRFMIELAEDLGEAVALSVPSGGTTTTIEQVDAPKPVRAEDWTGTTVPLHAGCVGLVTLAFWEDSEVDAYLANPLERFTESTVVDPSLVRERIASLREGEPLWTHGEFVNGLSSVASAVQNELGHAVAALYAYGPTYRFPGRENARPTAPVQVAALVLCTARRVSEDLGWVSGPSSTQTVSQRGAA